MKLFLLIILSGIVYLAGIPRCCADDLFSIDAPSENVHMKVVSQALDRIESSRNIQNKQKVAPINYTIPKRNEFGLSSEMYWAKFDEPKSYSQKGFLSGYNVQYSHRFSTNPKSMINMFSLQAQWANGKFKQEPYVGPSGIKDNTYDLRGVVGKDYYPNSSVRTTGYLGFGYRYLKDNSDGLVSNIGPYTFQGYNRFSHYFYLPLGEDMVYQFDPIYSLQGNLEYDYMFHGWETDKLGPIGYNTLVVPQGGGNGFRGSVRFNLNAKRFTAFAEAYYRYWLIALSKSKI